VNARPIWLLHQAAARQEFSHQSVQFTRLTPDRLGSSIPVTLSMNAKLLFKAVFLLIVLLLLLLMGLNNEDTVTFRLPPLVSKFTQKSAIMYFAFFAAGFLTATVVMAGGGRKRSSGAKPDTKP